MESRVALLEKTISEIETTEALLRKLEELKQLREVTKALQIQGFDGDEENIDRKEEKGEAGQISLEPKGKDVSNELEEEKDECLSQLKEDDLSRSNLMQFAEYCTLSEKQYVPESSEPQIADLQTKQHVRNFTEEQEQEMEQLKIFAELASVSELSPTDKEVLVKCWKDFESLQEEAELMTDIIKELRKENELLKSKSETFDLTFAHSLNERKRLEEELEKTKKQKATLESLCRSLQAERKKSSSQEKKE